MSEYLIRAGRSDPIIHKANLRHVAAFIRSQYWMTSIPRPLLSMRISVSSPLPVLEHSRMGIEFCLRSRSIRLRFPTPILPMLMEGSGIGRWTNTLPLLEDISYNRHTSSKIQHFDRENLSVGISSTVPPLTCTCSGKD